MITKTSGASATSLAVRRGRHRDQRHVARRTAPRTSITAKRATRRTFRVDVKRGQGTFNRIPPRLDQTASVTTDPSASRTTRRRVGSMTITRPTTVIAAVAPTAIPPDGDYPDDCNDESDRHNHVERPETSSDVNRILGIAARPPRLALLAPDTRAISFGAGMQPGSAPGAGQSRSWSRGRVRDDYVIHVLRPEERGVLLHRQACS